MVFIFSAMVFIFMNGLKVLIKGVWLLVMIIVCFVFVGFDVFMIIFLLGCCCRRGVFVCLCFECWVLLRT